MAGDLNFHSASYEWLVIAGAKAIYKGTGTVNGQDGYRFLVSAVDGAQPGGGGNDKFRIKIWNASTDVRPTWCQACRRFIRTSDPVSLCTEVLLRSGGLPEPFRLAVVGCSRATRGVTDDHCR